LRVSIQWLREWVDVDGEAAAVAGELTTAGLEVDAVEPVAPPLDGVVVAKVLDVEPHPQADRLSVCSVDAGGTRHRVVCGAPNVHAGVSAPFAPVGTRLPDGRCIEAAEIRGVTSDGMLCSAQELGLSDDASGLLLLEADAPAGTPLATYLRLDDEVLDIDLTPNRGDCFSVLGIARELAALHGTGLHDPRPAVVAPSHDGRCAVELAAGAGCPRFAGRVVRNVDGRRQSPLWLREKLRRAGLRAIHPVVDVTNYVMLELGQPLHAYDLPRIAQQIIVRYAEPGEELTLLDGKRVTLDPDVLVIADRSGAIGLAGIMGGESTAVTAATKDVLFEAAFFDPKAMQGRARRYGLQTDASTRFERGVDFTLQERAIERATALLEEIAGGQAGPVVVEEISAALPQREPIRLRHARLESVLGLELPAGEVEAALVSLGMEVEAGKGAWRVRPPPYRFDLAIEEDLVEEVGRRIGYDRIPATPGTISSHLARASERYVDLESVADTLVARGYAEIITYSFVDRETEQRINPGTADVELANPISSDMNVMRRSLWPGLLKTARENLSRQQHRLRLFEIGHQFEQGKEGVIETNVLAGLAVGPQWPEQWAEPARDADFFDVKADVEALLRLTGRGEEVVFEPDEHPALLPGQTARVKIADSPVGWLGVVHPRLQREFELRKPPLLFALQTEHAFAARVPHFDEYSKFPAVRRDLAVVVDEKVSVLSLLEEVRKAAGPMLRHAVPFDLYRGEGVDSSRKSVALGLILQDTSRTLTDEDAERTVQSVTLHLERELGATIRT
jgi:phenylalanyl-tRNA synthetase beta chain